MKKAIIVFLILLGVAIIVFVLNFSIVRSHKSKFTGPVSVEDPLPDVLLMALEDYVESTMKSNEVPGVAMVLVHGDEVVYSKGLGVRSFETNEPITNETLFGIGSITKPVTATVIGAMVDDGVFDWDTKLIEILPSFALSDDAATDQITIENTLCMCTGVPRRMEEISVRYEEMSAEDILKSLKKIALKGAYGNSFNYSSRMVASGGYVAALAAGGEYGQLAHAYEMMVQDYLLDPLEMTASTFSIKEAVSSGNFAVPYYSSLSGSEAISPELEGIFTPIAPAGALWSNAEDMSKFVITLLNGGISQKGRRIISSESLAYLWEPRVSIDPTIDYGLGWNIEDYHGVTVNFHPGGTVGFSSELVIIPDMDIGFVLLANQLDQVSPIGRLATYRLLEMLTGRDQIYDH
ncbi:MAG: serine hydrolase domain-containing protein [Anaerolineales bacterium]